MDGETGHRIGSLELMREEVFNFVQLAGAVFVGGMGGLPCEYKMLGRRWPDVSRVTLVALGGAVANLEIDQSLPKDLAERVDSRQYH